MKERTHKKNIEANRTSGSTATQIRQNKCERSKLRNSAAKAERQEKNNERLQYWRQLSPQEQLTKLDERLGVNQGASKQRKKIHAVIAESKKPSESQSDAQGKGISGNGKRRRQAKSMEAQGK